MERKNSKVLKFGGSSLSDAAQFAKVKAIVLSDPTRRFVVPSAPGKRFSADEKVTDLLYAAHAAAGKDAQEFDRVFQTICDRYQGLITELSLNLDLSEELETVKQTLLQGSTSDYAASRGEYLNGKILAAYLGFPFVDAAEVVRFTEGHLLDAETTDRLLKDRFSQLDYGILPGFYGSDPKGEIVTFSRGGSDISGALLAKAVEAQVYENFTDVSGVLAADPRIVSNPRAIKALTYRELRELSYMGASVLHEDAVFPVHRAKIPIHLQNTNAPGDPGTWITEERQTEDYEVVTGVSGKTGFSVITLCKSGMNTELGFGYEALSVLRQFSVPFEHMPTGIDMLSVVVKTGDLTTCQEALLLELDRRLRPDALYLEGEMALIAVVGQGMHNAKGTAAGVCHALAERNINIRMLSQASMETTIIVGVDESDYHDAIRAIYAGVFR